MFNKYVFCLYNIRLTNQQMSLPNLCNSSLYKLLPAESLSTNKITLVAFKLQFLSGINLLSSFKFAFLGANSKVVTFV